MAGPDPGWPNPLWFLLPGGQRLARRRSPDGGILTTTRALFMSFSNAVVLVGIVALIITQDIERDSDLVLGALVTLVVVGLASLTLASKVPDQRQPDCSSTDALVGWFRTRFFLRLAFGEVPALVAFVAVVVTGEWRLYVVGAAFTAVAFARAAPTAGRLADDDRRLLAAGCSQSLTAVLCPPQPE